MSGWSSPFLPDSFWDPRTMTHHDEYELWCGTCGQVERGAVFNTLRTPSYARVQPRVRPILARHDCPVATT